MKKYLFMIVVACVALACSKDNIQNDATPDNVQDAKGNISFVVDVESISDSKATISASDNFTWEDSDCAAVYTSEGSKVVLTPSGISGGVATFTGDVPSGETVVEGAIVVYPAAFLTAANTVTFPATYATNGQGTVLAAKVASGRKLTFKYLAATLKATITDVPSIASSITVTSTQTLTGAHTIDFTGSTPTLSTSSTAKEITFSSPANGNNELIIPVPTTGAAQTFTYKVNYSSNVLFTQSTTKTLARNTYMSMAPLTINPSVYLLSDMTGWSGENLVMDNSAGVASTTLGSRTGMYFRVKVKYPYNNYTVEMSPSSNVSEETTSGLMNTVSAIGGTNRAVLISNSLGMYTIGFNYLTGTYTISKGVGTPSLFAFGQANGWSMSAGTTPLTNEGDLFFILGHNQEYKINLSTYHDGSSIGSNGANNGMPGVYAFGSNDSGSDWYYTSVMYNGATNRYYVWNEGNTNGDQSYGHLYLRGSFNSWSEDGQLELTRSSVHNHIWYIIKDIAAGEVFKVTDNNGTWFNFSGGIFSWNTTSTGNPDYNAYISVAGKYLIVFNDSTEKYNIILTTAE